MRAILMAITVLALCVPAHASDFFVHPEPINGDAFVGFGAQFNGYLYSKPNWGTGGVNDDNVKVLEAKMLDLAPQHVRVFVEIQPDSPQGDPQVKASVIRTIELAQRCGATVNCTLWHGPYPDLDRAGQMMADMMADFIRNHHLDAIRYVTLQNEPNGFNMDMQRYNALYRAFDKALRANGLRDHIKIVGGDLLLDKQAEWFHNLADNLGDVCDGYSVHMYRDMWELPIILARPREVRELVNTLPKDRQRPLHLTEFGFRGHRTGKEEPGRDDAGRVVTDANDYALLCAWRLVDCLNQGFVSMVHWDAYDAWYDREPMHYGFCAEAKDGWKERPHFYLFRMFTHNTKPGWKALKVDGQRQGVMVAAMRGSKDQETIFAVNRTATAQTITIGGVAKSTPFPMAMWNDGGNGKMRNGKPAISDAAGEMRVMLSPQSAAAMSNAQ